MMHPRFSEAFAELDLPGLEQRSAGATTQAVDAILKKESARTLEDFAVLLSPAAAGRLEELAGLAQRTTRKLSGTVERKKLVARCQRLQRI